MQLFQSEITELSRHKQTASEFAGPETTSPERSQYSCFGAHQNAVAVFKLIQVNHNHAQQFLWGDLNNASVEMHLDTPHMSLH